MGKKSGSDPTGPSHHFYALACMSYHIHISSAHILQLLPHSHVHHAFLGQIHDLLQNSPLALCRESDPYRTDQRGMETCALLPLTSSSQTADSQEQNPIFRIWHSTNSAELSGPLSVTALQESNKTESLSTPTGCKAAQRRGSLKSKRKAREYNARGIREKINKDYEGSGHVPCPCRRLS